MEFIETDIPVDKIEVEPSDSADDFQKFIYELFDKNGILNDLRAYLRGHIVNVLKSVQTGDPLLCQKHFTQRLERASQALNILIAEYLLRLDFTYSLSVFVSEIPLSNMVFDFAKTLMKGAEPSHLRFKENDVWSVLNYLGVQCDSEHALKIVDMYKSENNMPLLHCILKCMPMYRQDTGDIQEENTSQDSLTSSTNSLEEKKAKIHTNISCHEKCRHYAFCKSCQHRILKIKEKYKKKKEQFVKSSKKLNVPPVNMENLMKNINVMEKSIIDEMFEQLKSVYEAEVDMVRQEEECRVKRTLASHALQLQQRQQELDESLKTREAELESIAHQKKQFLWGVARALRSQHEHVSRAMTLVKQEQELLAEKESNLKIKTLEAEEAIRKRGEEMRLQISTELAVLAEQLESMKRERDSLNEARDEFENLKSLCDSKTKIIEAHGEAEKQDLKKHYEKLKDEFTVLKKLIESTKAEPKNYVEQGTITDLENFHSNISVLNNTQCTERNLKTDINGGGVRPPNKVLNDLKKPKNVNFSQSNLDQVYGELSRERSGSSVSSDEGDERKNDTELIERLMEENENLKHYAKQQREHISALWSERVRSSLPSVSRPCTAPAVLPAAHYFTVHGVNPSTSANTFGWRKGAGEELSLFPEQRGLLPGEPLPLLGLVRERHSDNRRHLINQWRALKRSSPLAGVSKPRPPVMGIGHMDVGHQDPAVAAGSNIERMSAEPVPIRESNLNEHLVNTRHEAQDEHPDVSPLAKAKSREKSPKTVLKEAKEKLRNKSNIKEKPPLVKRDKSPNSMLREAKLRLRKLEIEAEAVEKSYKDFRKRQAELRDERESLSKHDEFINSNIVQGFGINQIKIEDTQPVITNITDKENLMKYDFDKYLRDYQTKYDIGETHFKNKTFVQKIKPIPSAYSEVNAKRDENKRNNVDYLSTPLMEFRKFYHAEKERTGLQSRTNRDQSKVGSKSDYCNIKINEDEAELLKSDKDETNSTKNSNKDIIVHEANVPKIVDNSESDRILKFIRDDVIDIQNENINNTNTQEQKENTVNVIEVKEHFDSIRLETLRKIRNNKAAELEILKENINKMYNLQSSPRSLITTVDETAENLSRDTHTMEQNIDGDKQMENVDTNLLMVEVESSCEINKVKLSESHEDELLIVVQSSANTKEGSEEAIEKPMSVIVSPKDRQLTPKDHNMDRNKSPSTKSESPEKSAELTNDVLNAIFHADDNHDISSVDMNIELGNIKDNISDVEKDAYDDYPDDFSADVDNYNSRSDYGNNSPISLPKTSEDENFWDN